MMLLHIVIHWLPVRSGDITLTVEKQKLQWRKNYFVNNQNRMRNVLRNLALGFIFVISAIPATAQVSISQDNTLPDPSAMLDVKSETMGVLIPRMTHARLASIANPAEGLIVFCTDCGPGALSIFVDGAWNTLNISCMSPAAPAETTTAVTQTGITWSWDPVPYSTGYRWNTENNYATATDLGSSTSVAEADLLSNTEYTRFVWAYNSCGESVVTTMTQTTLPVVTTAAVSGIGLATAASGGTVSGDGNASVDVRGVCWGTSPSPDINGSFSADGSGTGSFTSSLTGLSEGVIYYVRAYATNASGTSYGNEVRFATYVSDVDGNAYRTVIIGTQLWMAEHLKTTKYSDGLSIAYHTDWHSVTPEYAWYNNDITYKEPYGALYNYPAVSTGKLCPAGWHVASDAEWTTLTTFAGGLSVAGGKLKETGTTHWIAPNVGATDEYGFTLLPAGATQQIAAGFISFGYSTCVWTSNRAVTRNASNDRADMVRGDGYYDWVKNSVRCIKD